MCNELCELCNGELPTKRSVLHTWINFRGRASDGMCELCNGKLPTKKVSWHTWTNFSGWIGDSCILILKKEGVLTEKETTLERLGGAKGWVEECDLTHRELKTLIGKYVLAYNL